jgi:hypothetical protein
MIVESVQMLSAAVDIYGGAPVYKPYWKKHPCTVWTAKTRANYEWHLSLLKEMNNEYFYRRGKNHSSFLAGYEKLLVQSNLIPDLDITPFVNCSARKDIDDVIRAYQIGMQDKWKNDKKPPTWTKRGQPLWSRAV